MLIELDMVITMNIRRLLSYSPRVGSNFAANLRTVIRLARKPMHSMIWSHGSSRRTSGTAGFFQDFLFPIWAFCRKFVLGLFFIALFFLLFFEIIPSLLKAIFKSSSDKVEYPPELNPFETEEYPSEFNPFGDSHLE
ncbi:hypothetical protein [Candidatus Similichlamydia laticola]|nr:hypothetical protein [Candidatus Similichlamydia laticola]